MAGEPLLALRNKQDGGQSMAMNSSAAAHRHASAPGAKRGAKQAHAADSHGIHTSASEVPPSSCCLDPNPWEGAQKGMPCRMQAANRDRHECIK